MPLRKLRPAFHKRIWGSTRLQPWFPDPAEKTGEVWFETPEIPLLVKFIFTSENLSVQVHPDDAYARKHHDSAGKTEMWHILAAEPGAKIAAGFREPVTRDQMREAALSGEIEGLLEWFEAKPGDTFSIPAGTVHAIGAGLVLCEVQQRSDVTYRLYDYQRLENGRPRELHLDHGVAVSKLDRHGARVSLPFSGPYFSMERRSAGDPHEPSGHRPELLIAIAGSGTVDGEPVRAGEVILLEAGAPRPSIAGELRFLVARQS